jgi:Flp pilus assembly protein TadD
MADDSEQNGKEYYLNLGIRELDSGNIEGAIEAFRKAIEANPADPRPYRNLGIAYELLKDFQKAREVYEKALELNPASASNPNSLADVTHRLGYNRDAAFLYESAIASDPLYVEPYMNIARLFMEINAFTKAEPYIRKILDIEPGNADALNLLGIITNVTRRSEEAVGHFQEALRCNANQSMFFSNLGAALRNIGDLKRAIIAFEKAAELSPNNLSTMNNLGVLYLDTGALDRAEYFLRRAAEFYPENPFPFFNLAELSIRKADYSTALDHLKRYISLVPLDLDTLFKTCGIARMADRLKDAVEEMKSFIRETDSGDPRRKTVRAWLAMTKAGARRRKRAPKQAEREETGVDRE